jgi:hypothetical protein
MKIIFLLLLFPTLCPAQKIAENKIDDFTHLNVKRTTWESLVYKISGSIIVHTRISKIDSSYYLDIKYMGTSACLMRDNDALMFKMENDSIVTLTNQKSTLSCLGCGAINIVGSGVQGLDLSIPISKQQLTYLASMHAVKLRLYLSDGYIEGEIGKGKYETFIRQIRLML